MNLFFVYFLGLLNELRGGGVWRGNKTIFFDKFIDEVKMKMDFNEIEYNSLVSN